MSMSSYIVDEEATLLKKDNIEEPGWSFKSKLAAATSVMLVSVFALSGSSLESPSHLKTNDLSMIEHKLIAQRKNYDEITSHTRNIYDIDHVVEPDSTTVFTLTTCPDCNDLTWIVSPSNENYGSVDYDTDTTSNTLELVFSEANAKFDITIKRNDLIIYTAIATCKYVRRELRSINEKDLDRFFKALKVMYSTSNEDGQALYGSNYLSYAHLTGNHDTSKYQYHANMFFLTSHPVMQIRFERSLLSIDKEVVLNYWDFMKDHSLGKDWANSEIYSEKMFGPVKTSKEDNYRITGHFHDVKLIYDPDAVQYPDSFHTPRGFLGSNVMTSDSIYLQRSNSYCGFESIEGQVSGDNLVKCFDDYETSTNLREFDICLEEKVHANLHMMHAGQWDCAVSWSDFYDEHKEWLDEHLLSVLAVTMSSATTEYLFAGDIACPTTCDLSSADLSACKCTSGLSNIQVEGDVDKLTMAERFDLVSLAYEFIAELSVNALDYIGRQDAYEMAGTTFNNVFVPLNTKGEDASGEPMDNEQLDKLNTLVLKTVLFQGNVGIMMSGAAPNDPLFWVMHPVFDKALIALRSSPKYNSKGFTWNNLKEEMKWEDMTPFTKLDFEPYFSKGTEDMKTAYLKNSEIWDLLDPTSDSTYYIYDQFTVWGNTPFDPFA